MHGGTFICTFTLYKTTKEMETLKNFTMDQVETALANKGFNPGHSWGDEISGYFSTWEIRYGNFGAFTATVEGSEKGPGATIDGMHPTKWFYEHKKNLNLN